MEIPLGSESGKETRFGVNSICRTATTGILQVKDSEGKCLLGANANVGVKPPESSFLFCGLAVCGLMGSRECFMVWTLTLVSAVWIYVC